MRLLAWSRSVSVLRSEGKAPRIKSKERFACDIVCTDRDAWSDERRADHACQRIDLPRVEWTGSYQKVHAGGHMGRLPIVPSDLPPDWPPKLPVNLKRPPEDARDGCPGAWTRSRFIASVMPYLRRRTEGGGRVPNLLLDRCDDDLIVQLVNHAEHEQDAYEAFCAEEISR